LGQITDLGTDEVTWTVDLTTVEAAMPLAMLGSHGQPVRYLPGKAVGHAAAGYRGEGKTQTQSL
jgi:transposase